MEVQVKTAGWTKKTVHSIPLYYSIFFLLISHYPSESPLRLDTADFLVIAYLNAHALFCLALFVNVQLFREGFVLWFQCTFALISLTVTK